MTRIPQFSIEISKVKRWSVSVAVICSIFTGYTMASDSAVAKRLNSNFDDNTPIPHSDVSLSNGEGVVKAMLSCATTRYAHAVLGDTIEAGCLLVEDETGLLFQLDLPDHQVFEDLIPRIADINSDGRNDVVLVRSEVGQGAALAVYSIATGTDKRLAELAATPPIGTGNRWLAPVGIADFNNDGAKDVAYIQTPHIGGILRVWSYSNGTLMEIAQSPGYSNHHIGDTRVSTAKLQDINGDGVIDIALPDQARRNTVWVTLFPEFKVLRSNEYSLSDFD